MLNGDGTDESLAAIRAQTVAVQELHAVPGPVSAAALARGLDTAAAGEASWFWLLRAGTAPAPEALERLLGAVALPDGLPAPALLASKVVGGDGELSPASAPVQRAADMAVMIRAARQRLMALRSARYGSLLVRREAVAVAGPPRQRRLADEGDVEWTARLLRSDVGYLVPESVAVRRGSAGEEPASSSSVRERAAMIGGHAWTRDERLWLGVRMAQDLVTRSRPGAR